MGSQHRLKRLRELLAQLEQLPPSAERDRMLREVRARVVDVDTGDTPTTFISADVESILAAKADSARKRASRVLAPPPAPLPPPPPKPVHVPPSEPVRRGEVMEFAADVLLSLDDDSTPFWPSDGETVSAPWTRGLRG